MSEENIDINTIRFTELLMSLTDATWTFLGKKAHPVTGETQVNLPMAQWHIEMIAALEKKSAGNLEEVEEKTLQQMLAQLRLNYVDVVQSEGQKGGEPAASGEKAGDSGEEAASGGEGGEEEAEGKE